jgi:membrane dipeptidase
MLAVRDHRVKPSAWAYELSVSREAIDLYLASDIVDLHIDSFIWTRLFGYRLEERHGEGLFGARFYSQVDLPRIREARIAGGIWCITTNPLRGKSSRAPTFEANLAHLKSIFAGVPDDVVVCRNLRDYRAARAADKHAAFIGIQGGNALDAPGSLDRVAPDLLKVTLVHLSTSTLGATSAPMGGDGALTTRGQDFVRGLNAHRVFVDLAHINRRGFFDAIAVHDKTQPLLVSHTGVTGVKPHWRNIDDEQLRAVADTGGIVGVIYQKSFLGEPLGRCEAIVRHLQHIIDTIGEDHAALGSDWDGAIEPPRDMPTCLELPRLVDKMLVRGWSDTRIAKILGGNFLRALAMLRP